MADPQTAAIRWINLIPARGTRRSSRPGFGASVSLAWRENKRHGTFKASLSIGAKIIGQLGWAEPDVRVAVAIAPDAGLLRLRRVEIGGWKIALKGTVHTVAFPVPICTHRKGQRSARAPHRVEDGALIVTLPDWAVPQRRGVTLAREAAEAARRRMTAPKAA